MQQLFKLGVVPLDGRSAMHGHIRAEHEHVGIARVQRLAVERLGERPFHVGAGVERIDADLGLFAGARQQCVAVLSVGVRPDMHRLHRARKLLGRDVAVGLGGAHERTPPVRSSDVSR